MAIPSRVLSAGTNSMATISICGDGQTGITASGTTISDAFKLVAVYNTIGTAASGSGVILPVTEAGATIWVYNRGANTVKIYAKSGSTIDNGLSSFNLGTVSSVVFFATSNNTWATITNYIPTGSGTVTNVSALTLGTTGTDLSSTVVNSTTTPVITLNVPTASASNRGALSSADWITFNNKVSSVTGTAPVVSSGGATPAISMAAATASVNGYLKSTDWTTFNNKGSGSVTSVTGTAPVVSSGGTAPAISMAAATASVNGYLTSTDWTTFNSKGSGSVTSVTGTAPVVSSGGATPAISMAAATGSINGYLTSIDWTTFNNKGSGSVTSVGGTGTVNGITLTGTVTSSGSLTLGGTLSGVDLTSQVTGVLPIANGGTGFSSSQWLNVKSYGAVGDGSTDDTSAINSAIAAANNTAVSGGQTVYFPAGTYKVTSALTTVTREGVTLRGDGPRATVIAMASATGNTMTLGSGAQFASIREMAFMPSVFRTSGYEIYIVGGFAPIIYSIFIEFGNNGIGVNQTTRASIENVQLRYLTGTQGIWFSGTTGRSDGLFIKDLVCDNPYPSSSPSSAAWTSYQVYHTYATGDVFTANGWVWQVTTGGASGLTPPAAPTGTNWYSTSVVIGVSAYARAVCSTSLTWILMDSRAYSLTGVGIVLIDGYNGFKMINSMGGSNYPSWAFFYDLETDHTYDSGASLEAGYGFHSDGSYIGSSLTGNGITLTSSWLGEVTIQGTRVFGNAQHGILVNAGTNTKVTDNIICVNSVASSGSYNGVTVAANINSFTISGNSVGLTPTSSSSGQSYGIYVSAGTSDYYIIQGNLGQGTTGNVNGTYSDNGSGGNKSVTGNI